MKKSINRISLILLFSLFLMQCGEEVDQLTGNEAMSDLQAEATSILADGVSEFYVVATIVDSTGNPLSGALVAFTTTAGAITPKAYSDQNGAAVAIITSPASERDIEATVTASIQATVEGRRGHFAALEPGNKDGSSSASLQKAAEIQATEAKLILYFVGVTLSAQIDKTVLCADGLSEAQLRVSLKETTSSRGISGAQVLVRSVLSAILEEGRTDSKGSTVIDITSAAKTGTDTLTIEFGNLFRRSLVVSYQAPRITLLPEKADLLADGISTISMSAILVSQTNNPIPGAEIQFRCSDGLITGSATTSTSGEAVATFRGSTSPKNNVKVIAQFHDWADTALVNLVDSAPSQLLLAADKELLRNGISETSVKMTLLNAMQKPVVGAKVRFSTTAGSIDSTAVTDGNGQATALLRSDAGQTDVTALVRVSAAGITGQMAIQFAGITLQLSASPSVLPADGLSTATISAVLKKTSSKQAIPNVYLALGSSLGQLPATIATDGSGLASTTFQTSTQAGTAVITATYGLLTSRLELVTINQKPTSLQLSAESNYIWVTGTGLMDQCNITATAIGANGKPFQDELRVRFVLRNGPDGGEMLLPNDGNPLESSIRKTGGGSVSIGCKAGTRSGTVELQAYLVDYPEIVTRSTLVTVRSGPPYIWIDPDDPNHVESHMTVALDYFNLDGWNNVREFQVSIYVGDKYNNPVEEGTSLYLTSTAGIVTTSTRTDADGRGTAVWTTANPRPAIAPGDPTILAPHRVPNPNAPGMVLEVIMPDFEGSLVRNSSGTLDENDGIGLVMCSTHGRDQAGQDAIVYALNSAVFSSNVAVFTVETDKTILYPGQTALIAIRIFDTNGNPVAKGSTLTASSNAGELSITELMPSPERYGYGTTYFITSLLNTLDPTKDESKMAEVTLKLDSPNGTGTRTVSIYLQGK
jgi:adhesin/invasin